MAKVDIRSFVNTNKKLLLYCVIGVVAVGILIFLGATLFAGRAVITAELGETTLIVSTPDGEMSVLYDDIRIIDYNSAWDNGDKISGTDTSRTLSGIYLLNGIEYELAINTRIKKYIAVTYADSQVLVFNLESVNGTYDFYTELNKKLPDASAR